MIESALDLQREAGNKAVAALVAQRKGGPATTPFKPVGDIETMTVKQLDDYATVRPDWQADPDLPDDRKKAFFTTLEFARNGTPQPVSSMGQMPLKDVEGKGLSPDIRTKLRTYARGVASEDTAAIPRTDKIDDALRDGEALGKLEAGISKKLLHRTMGVTDEGKAEFPNLVAAKQVDKFVAYFQASHAYLEADNGADVRNYLKMEAEDHKNPADFIGLVPRVHNYHRFMAPMLQVLSDNEKDKSKKRPLLLILHSGSDHNGAFHRDKELTELVKHPRNVTIMVEGAETLDALGGEAEQIAKDYGQKGKIQQLMIAGHGGGQMMELAGKPDEEGYFGEDQNIDLQKNKDRTKAFLSKLMGNMDSGPDSRVILNACLTAADEVTAKLSNDPVEAKKQILDSLKNSPALATELQNIAGPGVKVEGNVSSVPAGKYQSEVGGKGTGILHQIIPTDPFAGSTDRAEYVEKGMELEGAMRAVVVVWATDKVELMKRIEARRKAPVDGSWDDQVIHSFYDLVAAGPDNVALMNRIANELARGMSEFKFSEHQTPWEVAGLHQVLSPPQEDKIIGDLYGLVDHAGQMAFDAVWMNRKADRKAKFMALLDTFATTTDASPHLWMGAMKSLMKDLLPLAHAAAPSTAEMKLALWVATNGGGHPDATAFLKKNAAGKGRLSTPAGTDVEGLTGGASSEDQVLQNIGLRAKPGGGGDKKPVDADNPPNYDADGDGKNDTYVRPVTRSGLVSATLLNLRRRPAIDSSRVGLIPQSTELDVMGESGKWYLTRFGAKTGFVHHDWVTQKAVD